MKIAVVGGLGYLGSHLVNSLESQHDLTIYDINLFNSSYLPNKAVLKQVNILDIDEDELEIFDIVFICSTVDIGCFYQEGCFKDYVQKYSEKIVSLNNLMDTKVVFFASYNSNIQNLDTDYLRYSEELEDRIIETNLNQNIKVEKVPELYGGSLKVRTDLFINDILSSFNLYKKYIISDNFLKTIKFCHVSKFVKYIIRKFVEDEDVSFKPCEMSKLMLVNYISWMLGDEYELYINPPDNLVLNVNSNSFFNETEELEHTLCMYLKLTEDNKTIEFFNINNSNRYIINNSIIGNKFIRDLFNAKPF